MSSRFRIVAATALAAALLLAVAPLRADYVEKTPEEIQNLGVDEHLDAPLPLDARFRDERGRIVRLREYFQGDRPVILSLNYSNCPMLCSLQLNGLVSRLRELEWTAGSEFQVVSVSIDPREQPHRALETRQKYLKLYGRGAEGWNFLVGGQASIDAVTSAVGLRYHFVPERNEYAHPAVAVLCTPDGRISRYLYGVEFPVETLRLSLVEASEGRIGSPGDQLLLFCFHYDPLTGTYAPRAARLAMSVGAALTVALLAGGLFVLWSRESLRDGASAPQETPHKVTAV